MIVYLDTSAFVKLIVDEDGAEQAREWFGEARIAVSSVITYPETCAALIQRDRRGKASGSRLKTWIEGLDDRWQRTVAVEVEERSAGRLALAHGLRGMDAVQLGAAVALRTRLSTEAPQAEVLFAAFDQRLLEAAEREGFATLGGPLG